MRHHHGRHCGCNACKTIVYPTKHNCVNQFSESTVNHVHPSHTTVMNHHLVKNNHVYPHSTSVQNTMNSVNQFGGAYNVPASPQQVAGAYSPPGGMGMGQFPGYGQFGQQGPGQVMGATAPGMGTTPPGMSGQGMGAASPGTGGQVMGATSPGAGMPYGGQWKKSNKGC